MKTSALVLCLLVGLPAHAGDSGSTPRGRGALTLVGSLLLGGGLAVTTVGLMPFIEQWVWAARAQAYKTSPPGANEEVVNGRVNKEAAITVSPTVVIIGGAVMASGIAALIIDTVLAKSPVAVAIVPTAQGGAVTLSGRLP